jgi:lysophospholipase L1-like esterase
MKIAFLGDSITEGIHGESFVDIIQENNPRFHIDNYGKGGDTVKSLYKRMQHINNWKEYDFVFLFIGVNDILGTLSWFYKLIKRIDKQPCSKNSVDFSLYYNKILNFLVRNAKKVVVLPPLFIGEDSTNKWNCMITELVDTIETSITGLPSIDYLNIRDDFNEYLVGKEISDYIPLKALEMKQDSDDMKHGKPVDEISKKRGLHTTIDGVHLNSIGAKIIADRVEHYFYDNTLKTGEKP